MKNVLIITIIWWLSEMMLYRWCEKSLSSIIVKWSEKNQSERPGSKNPCAIYITADPKTINYHSTVSISNCSNSIEHSEITQMDWWKHLYFGWFSNWPIQTVKLRRKIFMQKWFWVHSKHLSHLICFPHHPHEQWTEIW